jgi:hypothetical protein
MSIERLVVNEDNRLEIVVAVIFIVAMTALIIIGENACNQNSYCSL